MRIFPTQTIRQAERDLFLRGEIDSGCLMERVVRRLSALFVFHEALRSMQPSRVVVYAGRGNNAGDAIGLAASFACPVTLRAVCKPDELSPDARAQLDKWKKPIDTALPEPQPGLLLIDGLLGSGARGALQGGYASLAAEMNRLRELSPGSLIFSIDIPTGLDAETGLVAPEAVKADFTAPIGCVKPGMLADGAEEAVGQIVPIPLPEALLPAPREGEPLVLDAETVQGWLPRRAAGCFKNVAGRVAIVAGSPGMLGAAQLCSEAALYAGAGLVVLYCLPESYSILASRVAPEVMVRCVSSYAEVEEKSAQALLIGPGLGELSLGEQLALQNLAEGFGGVVVLDADGLNMAAARHWRFSARWVLTPHPGEMRRLDPRPTAPRETVVRRFLEEHDCTLLLKGARSIIADRRQVYVNSTGGPFMANGGQGDVLAGVTAGLAAQGLSPLRAAALASYTCGLRATVQWFKAGFPRTVPAGRVMSLCRF